MAVAAKWAATCKECGRTWDAGVMIVKGTTGHWCISAECAGTIQTQAPSTQPQQIHQTQTHQVAVTIPQIDMAEIAKQIISDRAINTGTQEKLVEWLAVHERVWKISTAMGAHVAALGDDRDKRITSQTFYNSAMQFITKSPA